MLHSRKKGAIRAATIRVEGPAGASAVSSTTVMAARARDS